MEHPGQAPLRSHWSTLELLSQVKLLYHLVTTTWLYTGTGHWTQGAQQETAPGNFSWLKEHSVKPSWGQVRSLQYSSPWGKHLGLKTAPNHTHGRPWTPRQGPAPLWNCSEGLGSPGMDIVYLLPQKSILLTFMRNTPLLISGKDLEYPKLY